MNQTHTAAYTVSNEESYMSSSQLQYFEEKLYMHRDKLTLRLRHSRKKIQEMKAVDPDILDRSNAFITIEQEIAASERYSRYLRNIDNALSRIQAGTFGFCAITGEEIGFRRLEAQPWALLSIAALEELEINHHNIHEKALAS